MISRRAIARPAAAFAGVALALALALLGTALFRPGAPPPQDAPAPVMAAILEDLAELAAADGFERPSGPWQPSLPADHGAHPAARAETWTIAAHLADAEGMATGLTFSLSRFGLRAEAPASGQAPWILSALYRAHVTLARQGLAPARGEERFSRGGGLAGHDPRTREVWLDHWRLARGEGGALVLEASVEGRPLRLVLSPLRPARAAGGGDAPLRGFALPRLAVEGEIGRGAAAVPVSGTAWLDRAWGELPMPGGPLVYERLILQLADGTDLSLLRARRRDGRGGATLDGVILPPTGPAEPVTGDRLRMEAVPSPRAADAIAHPTAFRIAGAGLDLEVAPLVAPRPQGFVLPGWTGTVAVSGRRDGAEVAGLGTLQVSGGAAP